MIVHQLQARTFNNSEWEILKEDTNLELLQKNKTEWESINNTREYRIVQIEKEFVSKNIDSTTSYLHMPISNNQTETIDDSYLIGGSVVSFLIFAAMFIIRRFKCVPSSAYLLALSCIIAMGVVLSIKSDKSGKEGFIIGYHIVLMIGYVLFV